MPTKVLAVLLAGIFVTGLVLWTPAAAQKSAAPAGKQPTAQGPPIRSDGSSIMADVAEKVGPGVVFVRTERSHPGSSDRDRFRSPFEFFREFFPDDEERREFKIPGGGSGFFFDGEGRVLTNYHVVKDAEEIVVVMELSSGEVELEAEIVGFDPRTDIAIIQVDPPKSGVTVVPLGDSDACRVGDWVMAIGTPFGQLVGTVTAGIISAKGRTDINILGGSADFQNYIQTDASINFGNSGGPLVNMKGQAIGINAAINASGQGIGFAIPINMAKNVMTQLIADGRVRYGFIGIQLQELDKTIADGLGLQVDHGIFVRKVLDGYPAEEAGIRQKDVILEYNGEAVRNSTGFSLKVGNTPIGKTVPIVVWRDGQRKQLSITIAERPEDNTVAAAETRIQGYWLGLEVDNANSREVRQRFETARGQKGVIVLGVEEGSPAEDAGIREGDIITEVYSQSVDDLEGYLRIAEKLKDRKDPIAFLVKRGKSTTYVPVKPGKR
jgi:serine protease Do